MASDTWTLALVTVIYYIPCTFGILYCLWRHRQVEILGWLFLFGFISLQVIGSGMTLSVGQNGTPSSTAIIITSVGLSSPMLGTAGIVHELAKLGWLVTRNRSKKVAWVLVLVYHMGVAGATAIYAVGTSNSCDPATAEKGKSLAKAGVILLLTLWTALLAIFAVVSVKMGAKASRALFWAVVISILLISIRIIYQWVATFSSNPVFNPVTGSIALRAVFQFLTGALALLVLIIGGVMSGSVASSQKSEYQSASNNMPLHGIPITARGETDGWQTTRGGMTSGSRV